ncbi:MAG: hypothetical protein M1376_11420 [Planctomycetes bacterium]|nr:hypothetical protein [Planctomycetota bacterium]
MRLFQIEDLRALAERRQWPCVSLYLPTHRAGRKETQGDPIRLKNAVADAKEQLAQAGYPKDSIITLLEPASRLVSSRDFWLHRADGLALFLAPEFFQFYRVPLKLQDEVVLADHFSVRQLIPLFSEDGRFYILALSQKRIRFFEATRSSIQERVLPDMLRSIADLKQYDEAEEQLQSHTLGSLGAAGTSMVFHGQGAIADKATYKADVRGYVNIVCKKLERYLDGQAAPLIVAAVEYEQSFYRQANSYHNLLEQGIVGNPDGLTDDEIHRAAWGIVEPHFAEARSISLKHFADLSHTDKATDKLEEILPAACHGRVRTLFIETQARTWGKFDVMCSAVERHDSPAPGDVDLIDLVTVCVLQNKGMIYALSRDQMPTASNVAAFFRY